MHNGECGSAQRYAAAQYSTPVERRDDRVGGLFGGHRGGVDADVRILGRLVWAVDAGEVGKLAGAGLGIEALVLALGFRQRVSIKLDESPWSTMRRTISRAAERLDKRGQHD